MRTPDPGVNLLRTMDDDVVRDAIIVTDSRGDQVEVTFSRTRRVPADNEWYLPSPDQGRYPLFYLGPTDILASTIPASSNSERQGMKRSHTEMAEEYAAHEGPAMVAQRDPPRSRSRSRSMMSLGGHSFLLHMSGK